jgi:hypothetical protein
LSLNLVPRGETLVRYIYIYIYIYNILVPNLIQVEYVYAE